MHNIKIVKPYSSMNHILQLTHEVFWSGNMCKNWKEKSGNT